MAFNWNSSTLSDDSTDQNPQPYSIDQSLDAIESQLASITLAQPDTVVVDEEYFNQELPKEAENGLLGEDNNRGSAGGEAEEAVLSNRLSKSSEVEGVEEVRNSCSTGVVWRRTDSELEVDAPASPSSSGYAGGRGSSCATSASGMEDVGEDEIRKVGKDCTLDGVSDSQTSSWVPRERHVDECRMMLLFHGGRGRSISLF